MCAYYMLLLFRARLFSFAQCFASLLAFDVGKEEISRVLDAEELTTNRDAMCKSLYSALFQWVVSKVNSALYRGDVESVNWIGLLDVFGFECFEHNSFEQVSLRPH